MARRYDLNANQLFNWIKDPRFASAAAEFRAFVSAGGVGDLCQVQPIHVAALGKSHAPATVKLRLASD